MLKIGLPKGSSKNKSLNLIKRILNNEINEKQLYFNGNGIEFILLKQRDIPIFVEKGLLDVGIVPEEWMIEKKVKLDVIKELDWCNTRISLISKSEKNVLNANEKIKCVTEFPNISKKFLDSVGKKYEICNVSGASEAVVPRFFNCCIDCVETGETLKSNNLKEEFVILKSKTVVVKNSQQPYNDELKNILNMIS